MSKKLGYILITLGVLILGFNFGYLNLNLLTQSISLPSALLIIGLIELLIHYFDLGEFNSILKGLIGLLLILIIVLNLSVFLNKFFTASFNWVESFPEKSNFSEINDQVYNIAFMDLNLSSTGTELRAEFNNGEEVIGLNNDEDYEFFLNFGSFDLDFINTITVNNSLHVVNSFGETSLKNLKNFNRVVIDSSFSTLTINTGELNGENLLNVSNNFGNVNLYIDEGVSYWIERSNNFGIINNQIGLKSDDYALEEDKIHIIIDNNFGSVNLELI